MDESLRGKVAAITGAASGIGLACARALLAAGARVVLRGNETLEEGQRVRVVASAAMAEN